MARAESTALRGFDSYRVSLGDELRGERASLGKSLLDVQRDLRIKAAHIDAIESANPAGIPYPGYVTGYVRAYARYLGLDEDTVLRRFCDEAGFTPVVSIGAAPDRTAKAGSGTRRSDLDAVIAGSKLAAVSRTDSFHGELGATLRGLGSLAVLLAVVSGLGYGGWAILQNIQRIEFSPLPDAPVAMASAPEFGSITRVARAGVPAAPVLNAQALAAVYAAQEVTPPRIDLRDGPISTIDPRRAGVYAETDSVARPLTREAGAASLAEAGVPTALVPPDELMAAASREASAAPPPSGVVLVVTEDAWVRVRDGAGRTLLETLMKGGQRWEAPENAKGLTIRAGNAGSVFVEVDGARHGPLGEPGRVVSNVSLEAGAVRSRFVRNDPELTTSSLDSVTVRAR